jgi:hypothetical protein
MRRFEKLRKPLLIACCAGVLFVSRSHAAPVSLFEGRVKFEPPTGVAQLTPRQMKSKFPGSADLRYAFENKGGTEQILVYVLDVPAGEDELPAIKGFVERTQKDYSGWITSELITMNERKWFHFEWQKPPEESTTLVAPAGMEKPKAKPAKIEARYFDEYTTSFGNHPLRFAFQSTRGDDAKIKDSFTKSAATIRVNK